MKTNVTRVIDEPTVIQASRIVISEGRRPTRVVLRKETNKYIVHTEYLDMEMNTVEIRRTSGDAVEVGGPSTRTEVMFTHSHFDDGQYFDFNLMNGTTPERALEKARDCFHNRSEKL